MPGGFTTASAAPPTGATRRDAPVREEDTPMLAQPIREDSVAAAVRPEVEACIRGLLADHLGVDIERIAPEVSLVEDLAADSLDLLEIALAIEGNLALFIALAR